MLVGLRRFIPNRRRAGRYGPSRLANSRWPSRTAAARLSKHHVGCSTTRACGHHRRLDDWRRPALRVTFPQQVCSYGGQGCLGRGCSQRSTECLEERVDDSVTSVYRESHPLGHLPCYTRQRVIERDEPFRVHVVSPPHVRQTPSDASDRSKVPARRCVVASADPGLGALCKSGHEAHSELVISPDNRCCLKGV